MTKEQIQREIEEMDAYVPVKTIEERLGMPPTTLQKVLKGERKLPKKWHKVLEAYFIRKPQVEITDLNENASTASNKTKPAPKTNFTINTTKKENSGELSSFERMRLKRQGY